MRWLVLACLAACSFQHGTLQQGPKDGALIDTATIDSPIDARMVATDAPTDATMGGGCSSTTCSVAGGTCNNGTCEITAQNGQAVMCPSASDCSVTCPNDNQSCRNGMTCPLNADCTFHCDADHSCDNGSSLTCAAGSTCEIFCKGTHSCDNLSITCANGATCKYHCCGTNSCGSFGCQATGLGTCINAGSTCP